MDFSNERIFYRYMGVLLLVIGCAPAWAQVSTSQPAADNSKVNQQDRSPSEPTADQQKNNGSDQEVTRAIRSSLTKDKSLSTYAHNVKVITQNGKVTLKGPVRSADEKAAVLAKAGEVAGKTNVNDEMTVVPKND